MTITVDQQVDFLWKKIGYDVAKTDVANLKSATNESIVSLPLLPGDKIWNQSDQIGNVQPSSTTGVVFVHSDANNNSLQCTQDVTATPNRTWLTGYTDWIPTVYGSTYNIKVYVDSTGSTTPQTTGIQLYASGSSTLGVSNNDEWFFDYQAGVLNFIGTNLPNGINFTGKSVFIVGARYTGTKGLNSFANSTLGNLTISGGDTITNNTGGNVGIGNITVNTTVNGTTIYSTSPGNLTLSPLNSNSSVVVNSNAALVIPVGNTAQRPVPAALGDVRYNTDLSLIEFYNGSGWITTIGQVSSYIYPNGTFDGTTTTFPLPWIDASAASILVIINGVVQQPNNAYVVVGTNITFAAPPLPTDSVELRGLASVVAVQSNLIGPVANLVISAGGFIEQQSIGTAVDTTPVIIDQFNSLQFRSAKYFLSISNTSISQYMNLELSVLQDSANAYISSYNSLFSGNAALISVSAALVGTTVEVKATGTHPGNVIKFHVLYVDL